MKVLSGEIDKYRKTFPLLIEDEIWRIVHVSIFGSNPNFGQCHTPEELEDKFKIIEKKGTKAFLLRKLSLRNYHSMEVMRALKEHKVSEDVIFLTLNEFKSNGYLNDEAWISSFIQAMRIQKFGFKSILLKLRRKGIADEESIRAIQAFKQFSGEDEQISIDKLLISRYKNRNFLDKKEQDKVIASLVRRGYQLTDIFSAINNYKDSVVN